MRACVRACVCDMHDGFMHFRCCCCALAVLLYVNTNETIHLNFTDKPKYDSVSNSYTSIMMGVVCDRISC